MWELILPYVIEMICTLAMAFGSFMIHGASKKIDAEQKRRESEAEQNKAMKDGVRALLRDRIRQKSEYHIKQGYCSLEDRDIIEAMYVPFHSLGGNSTTTEIKNKAYALPTSPVNPAA